MKAMHNPGLQPVDNSAVDNDLFYPQPFSSSITSAAPVTDKVSDSVGLVIKGLQWVIHRRLST